MSSVTGSTARSQSWTVPDWSGWPPRLEQHGTVRRAVRGSLPVCRRGECDPSGRGRRARRRIGPHVVETAQGESVAGREDVADLGARAVSRIKFVAACDAVFELCFEAGELALACAHIVELVEKQRVHVTARDLAVIAKVDDTRDLAQSKAGGLGGADEPKAGNGGVVVIAVAVRAASGRGEQALPLVKPDGLAGEANAVGDLSDPHEHKVLLDLAVRIKD